MQDHQSSGSKKELLYQDQLKGLSIKVICLAHPKQKGRIIFTAKNSMGHIWWHANLRPQGVQSANHVNHVLH